MLLYSVILFAVSALFVGLAVAIGRGHTNLIHDYHQTNVVDKAAYGKAFAKALLVMAAAMLLSGIVALLENSERFMIASVAILFAGMGIGFGCIVAVQKKYNNGMF